MSNETTDILTALYHTMPHALGYHEDALHGVGEATIRAGAMATRIAKRVRRIS